MKPVISNISLEIPFPTNGNSMFCTGKDYVEHPTGVLLHFRTFRNNNWYFEDIYLLKSFYDTPFLFGNSVPLDEFEGWNIMRQLLQV